MEITSNSSWLRNVRSRIVIWLRISGILPWIFTSKLRFEVALRKLTYRPREIPLNSHVLIVCAYYNHPRWVLGMVESIQAQTFQNWTLMIMDDCSPSPSLKEICRVFSNDKRIKTFKVQTNKGAYACRNACLSLAAELPWTHVTFIDPDDQAYPTWLSDSLEFLGSRSGVLRVVLERWDEKFEKKNSMNYSHAPSFWTRDVWEQLVGFLNTRIAADTELLLRAKYFKSKIQILKGIRSAQRCRVHGGNSSRINLLERKNWLLDQKRRLKRGSSDIQSDETS